MAVARICIYILTAVVMIYSYCNLWSVEYILLCFKIIWKLIGSINDKLNIIKSEGQVIKCTFPAAALFESSSVLNEKISSHQLVHNIFQ